MDSMTFFSKSTALLVQPIARSPRPDGGFYNPGAMFTFYGGRNNMNEKFDESKRVQLFLSVRRLGELHAWLRLATPGATFMEIHKTTNTQEKRMRFACTKGRENDPMGNALNKHVFQYFASVKNIVNGNERERYNVPLSMGDAMILSAVIPHMIGAALGYTTVS